jgi:hypothetical protein
MGGKMKRLCVVLTLIFGIHLLASAAWWDKLKDEAMSKAKDELIKTTDVIKGEADITGFAVSNYTDQSISASGFGPANIEAEGGEMMARAVAEEIARTQAYLKLAETLDGTYINARISVDDAKRLNSSVDRYVKGYVKGAQVIRTEFEKKGKEIGCLVTLKISLGDPGGMQLLGMSEAAEKQPENELYEAGANAKSPGDYSGVVIDARGLALNPAMMPRILTPDGKVIYGPEVLSSSVMANGGLVAYVRSEKEARVVKAGKDPFIVKALKTIGKTACDLVLPSAVADELFGLDKEKSVLSDGKVVILTD